MQIQSGGSDVNYVIHGTGKPLVILHGFMLDHEIMLGGFEPLFEERDGWQRIYIDMPGMGLSTGTDAPTSAAIVDAVLAVIDHVIPGQTFSLVGFSYGGYIARGVIKRRPASVDGLTLIAPVADLDPLNRDVPEPMVIVHDPEAAALLPEAMSEIVLHNIAVQAKPIIERIIREYSASFPRADQNFLAKLRDPQNYIIPEIDVLESPFAKPVLIITGKQDANVGYAGAFAVSRLYPRATYTVLDRAGHGVYMEQDVLFRALVFEWLDRVEEAMLMQTSVQ